MWSLHTGGLDQPLESHPGFKFQPETLQLCDLGWVSWVLILSLSSCPLGVIPVNLLLAGQREVKPSKEQSVLTMMPKHENRWPCLWHFSPHFITFSSSAWTHIFKTMWNYHSRWNVQRIWCQNTAKHLRLSTCQANPGQQQRTWDTCIPVSVGLSQLAPHLRLICFPSVCPAVRLTAASCSPFWEAQWHKGSWACVGLPFTQKCIIECLAQFH